MALTELWKTAHKEIQDKHVQQVIGFAGDGKLRDGVVASKEFPDFLALVPSNFLSRYAIDCLTDKFDNSGLAFELTKTRKVFCCESKKARTLFD